MEEGGCERTELVSSKRLGYYDIVRISPTLISLLVVRGLLMLIIKRPYGVDSNVRTRKVIAFFTPSMRATWIASIGTP